MLSSPLTDALWSSLRHLGVLDDTAPLALCSDEVAAQAPPRVVALSLQQSPRPPVDAAVGLLPPLEAVQSLRRGGVAALLAPVSFLDARDSMPRRLLCCHAELLLALRLPQGVVTEAAAHDVLLLRHRDVDLLRPAGDWLESTRLDEDADDQWSAACAVRPAFGALEFNRYWHRWPGHALGKWTTERGQGGVVGVAVRWRDGEGVAELCRGVVSAVQRWADAQAAQAASRRAAEAPAPPPPTTALSPRDRAAKRLLGALRAVLAAQQHGDSFADEQRLLGAVYGAFVSRWGLLRDVDRDTVGGELWSSWPLLRSLETRSGGRAAAFTRRVVAVVSAAMTSPPACIYRIPDAGTADNPAAYETAERYLSGDVAQKLHTARAFTAVDATYQPNVDALAAVQPPPVRDVAVSLGAGFVPAAAYVAFIRHLLPAAEDWTVSLTHAPSLGWRVDWRTPALLAQSVANTTTWGTRRCDAMTLLSLALRLDSPVVYDKDGDERSRNSAETAAAQAKLADIREEWSRWWRGSCYAAAIVDAYNARFNAHVARRYDGSWLAFPGLAACMPGTERPLQPRRHQLAGALRIFEQGELDGTVLLTYRPGAGKTIAAILGIVKRVQTGLTRKACVVVPRHVVGQWRDALCESFPGMLDRFLVADDDFSKRRRDFLAEAVTPHVAIVVLSYEQFRTIGLSPAAHAAYYSREVAEVYRDLVDHPDDRSLQRELKRRESRLEKLRDLYARKCAKGRDSTCWEDFGFDLLCLDEAHYCKAVPFSTRMRNVSGLPRSESQRAVDAMMKIHWVAAPELYGPRGVGVAPRLHAEARSAPPPGYPRGGKVVGLTGTPVTNTLAEVWAMMRLLQPRLLRERGLWGFDSFAAVFCEQVPTVEMDAVGRYRTATRLKWQNIPELQRLLSQCWDRAGDLGELRRPEIATGRMRVVEVQGSPELRQYVAELAARADRVRRRLVDPADDNMLKITHDGRVAGLFNGPPSEAWPTDRRTKVDACADVVWDLYCQSDSRRGVVLVFCDLFTPKSHSGDGDAEALTPAERFVTHGVYGVLRQKLQQRGVRADEVAFVHDAEGGEERDALFRAVRKGTVRVLVGSTQKLATGVNVQDRVYGMVHLTVPWRPDWLTQADARGDRDGNLWAEWGHAIHSVAVVTVGSYDVVSWQMIEQKAAFISQIVNDEYEGRVADDVGDLVITANVAKAIALGDLRVVEKTQLEVELSRLSRCHRLWREDEARRQHLVEDLPRRVADEEVRTATLQAMAAAAAAHPTPAVFAATLRGSGLADVELIVLTDRAEASRHCYVVAERLRGRVRGEVLLGEYRGAVLTLDLSRGVAAVSMQWAAVEAGASYSSDADATVQLVGGDVFATLDHKLSTLDADVAKSRTVVDALRERLAEASAPSPPWRQGDEAAALLLRYEALCDGIAASQAGEDGEGVVERKRWSFST